MARILVIEDDLASQELMVYLLRNFGHEPLAASDGAIGLALARSAVPDLILCDIQMPKLDGYAVAAQLKADPQLRAIPLVAVTAFAMVGDQDRVLAAGFDGYVTKPIAPDAFVSQAEAFLATGQNPAPRPQDLIPQAQPMPQQQASTPETSLPPSQQATILVVDNSPENLEFLRFLFEFSGYEVIAVSQIREAVERARQQPPDLILCDLHLQGESGLDFIRLAKAHPQLSQVPFIIISSTAWQQQDQLDALALGASKFILRPIEPEALLAEVERSLLRKE
jgi:two-component system cell cycle response regulator